MESMLCRRNNVPGQPIPHRVSHDRHDDDEERCIFIRPTLYFYAIMLDFKGAVVTHVLSTNTHLYTNCVVSSDFYCTFSQFWRFSLRDFFFLPRDNI